VEKWGGRGAWRQWMRVNKQQQQPDNLECGTKYWKGVEAGVSS